MKIGVNLGLISQKVWRDVATEADRLGFESVWLPEHLVFPVEMKGQLRPGEEHPPVPPNLPLFDAPAYLCWLAGQTEQIRLGTFVHLFGLRHPFISARAFATLDVVSGGRAEVGIGAGWLTTEWDAVGFDPTTRGRRLDECVDVAVRLWTEEVIEHHGEFYDFQPVMFEPKPVQQPHPPLLVGGEGARSLRRAARLGGWIGMHHTPESVREQIEAIRGYERELGRASGSTHITVPGPCADEAEYEAWEAAGVDRLILETGRTRDTLPNIRAFAARFF